MRIGCQFLGRFGNCLFSYAFARAFAEQHGWQLQTDPWIGQKIFQISDPPIDPDITEKRDENTIEGLEPDFIFRSYAQQQKCLIYSREQVKRWFTLRPEIQEKLDRIIPHGEIVAHLRRGDFGGYGYVIVSEKSYRVAAIARGIDPDDITWISDEKPALYPDFQGELSFLPDFYRMMKASVLFRANSSFSWWGATLSDAKIYSPRIEGFPGGVREKECVFEEGNWPRLANLAHTTDLYLNEK